MCLMIAMKTEKDILKSAPELKNLPYSVPEGYFDRMKAEAVAIAGEREERQRPFIARLAPYAAIAAVFTFLVTAGTFLLERTTPADQMDIDEFYFYSNMIPVTDPYAVETIKIGADEGDLEYEDIIEYLIYSGVTAEVIEFSR